MKCEAMQLGGGGNGKGATAATAASAVAAAVEAATAVMPSTAHFSGLRSTLASWFRVIGRCGQNRSGESSMHGKRKGLCLYSP